MIVGKVDKDTLYYYYSLLLKLDAGCVISVHYGSASYEKYVGYILDEDGKYVSILLSDFGNTTYAASYNENVKKIAVWLKDTLPGIAGSPFTNN